MTSESTLEAIAGCLLSELSRGRLTEPMVNDIMDHCREHHVETSKDYAKAVFEIRREHLYRMIGYEI